MNKTINTYYGQANRTTETESFDFMQKSVSSIYLFVKIKDYRGKDTLFDLIIC